LIWDMGRTTTKREETGWLRGLVAIRGNNHSPKKKRKNEHKLTVFARHLEQSTQKARLSGRVGDFDLDRPAFKR